MDKREIDEQLKNLSFDMDDEIDDRNERLGHRSLPASHVYRPMDPSHAIILAALIIVGGLWGGKLLYDYIQEQRMKAALNEAGLYMQQAMRQAEESSRQALAKSQQRMAREDEAREKRQAEQLAQNKAEQARIAQEKRFESAQCQFWWQQYQQNPTAKASQKRSEACGEN